MHVVPDNDRAAERAVLPSRLGGLGIMCMTHAIGNAVHLAAAAVSDTALGKGPHRFRTFGSPGAEHLLALWVRLHATIELLPDRSLEADRRVIA